MAGIDMPPPAPGLPNFTSETLLKSSGGIVEGLAKLGAPILTILLMFYGFKLMLKGITGQK